MVREPLHSKMPWAVVLAAATAWGVLEAWSDIEVPAEAPCVVHPTGSYDVGPSAEHEAYPGRSYS